MRRQDLRAPVGMFARGGSPDRRQALGATDAHLEWAGPVREIERVLG